MKKILKKRTKVSANTVRYFSPELVKFVKEEHFNDGTSGRCTYLCGPENN